VEINKKEKDKSGAIVAKRGYCTKPAAQNRVEATLDDFGTR
jgi:hypothetical protein